jgi:hypothetical protein
MSNFQDFTNSNTTASAEFYELSTAFHQFRADSFVARGEDPDNPGHLRYDDLCTGLHAISERWETLYGPLMALVRVRNVLCMRNGQHDAGAATVIDNAVTAMLGTLSALDADYRAEYARVRPQFVHDADIQ